MTAYPQSVNGTDRFTPQGLETEANPPVYLIGIANMPGRAAWRREMTARGARFWAPAEFHRLAREYIEAVAPANAEELLSQVDALERVDELTETEAIQAVAAAWTELSEVLIRRNPIFAARHADNQHWLSLAPMIAARMFLTGWENVDLKYRRDMEGMLADDVAKVLADRGHLDPIGWRAMALMQPQETERKNFVSPQPSPPTRKRMTAASSRKMTGRDGKSSANSTRVTRD
jgi:hypothetical protein